MGTGGARIVKDKLAKLHSHLFLLEGRGTRFLVQYLSTILKNITSQKTVILTQKLPASSPRGN